MPTIQELIHKFEVGEGTRYIKLAAIVLLMLGLAVMYDIREFKNFSTQEAMDTAQLARNIAEGEGYTTQFIRPLSIHLLQKHRGESRPVLREPHPDISNPPVYPALLAALMTVYPFRFDIIPGTIFWAYQPEAVIAVFNQLLFSLTIFLMFFLARRLFDGAVAWVTVLVLVGTELFWRFTMSGLSTPLLMLLLVGIVWCVVLLEQQHREGQRGLIWFGAMATLTGVLVGVGALTRYSFGWMIIPVVAFFMVFFGQRRAIVSIAALAGCLVVMAPWLARNYYTCGTPFGTAGYTIFQDTTPFRGNRLERFLNGEEFQRELSRAGADELTRKLMTNVSQIIQHDLPRIGGNWMSAFFLASLLIPFRNVALSRLRMFVLFSLATLIVVQALGRTHLSAGGGGEIHSENLLVIVAPVLFAFGVAMLLILLDQINWPFSQLRTAAIGGCVLLVSAPLILTLLPPRALPYAYPPYWPPGIQDSAGFMEKHELMMSDMPWAVAWYGDRDCLWATLDGYDGKNPHRTDFFRLYDLQRPIQAIYLTTLTTDAQFYSQMLRDKDYAWSRLMIEALLRGNVPSGFPLRTAPPYFLESGQLFLTDRVRWKKPSS